ncbi:Gfo/Idh/MocA family protein [Thermodesulfobacteriota bacterium]
MGVNLKVAGNTNHPRLKVLIIGCGNIAGRFDQSKSSNLDPSTHAGAYEKDGRFEIIGCVEPDDQRRTEFMESWSVPHGFNNIAETLETEIKPDVISICTPSENHTNDIINALAFRPKLIFCEKPLSTSVADAEKIIDECDSRKTLLAVNYTRRWDPDIHLIQHIIRSGELGPLRFVSGIYNKGLLNNGSHMIDLLLMLVEPITILHTGNPILDYSPEDPTIPFWLEGLSGIPIQIGCSNAKDYALFELNFVFSKGFVSMENGGLFWRERRACKSSSHEHYRFLNEGHRRSGKYSEAILNAVDNIYNAVWQKEKLRSNGETAIKSLKLCEKIPQYV